MFCSEVLIHLFANKAYEIDAIWERQCVYKCNIRYIHEILVQKSRTKDISCKISAFIIYWREILEYNETSHNLLMLIFLVRGF
jgi:hypothetical protein